MGGTIPKDDVQTLLNMGVDLIVATQHKSIDEIVGQIITLALNIGASSEQGPLTFAYPNFSFAN